MYCRKCGRELPDDAEFCSVCGTVVSRLEKRKEENPYQILGVSPEASLAEIEEVFEDFKELYKSGKANMELEYSDILEAYASIKAARKDELSQTYMDLENDWVNSDEEELERFLKEIDEEEEQELPLAENFSDVEAPPIMKKSLGESIKSFQTKIKPKTYRQARWLRRLSAFLFFVVALLVLLAGLDSEVADCAPKNSEDFIKANDIVDEYYNYGKKTFSNDNFWIDITSARTMEFDEETGIFTMTGHRYYDEDKECDYVLVFENINKQERGPLYRSAKERTRKNRVYSLMQKFFDGVANDFDFGYRKYALRACVQINSVKLQKTDEGTPVYVLSMNATEVDNAAHDNYSLSFFAIALVLFISVIASAIAWWKSGLKKAVKVFLIALIISGPIVAVGGLIIAGIIYAIGAVIAFAVVVGMVSAAGNNRRY